MARIKEVHGLAQAAKESQHADPLAARVGTKLFRDGHRKGFWDGVEYALTHREVLAEMVTP